MWNPLPASAEKYIHRPSGDHAALVHLPGRGPTCLPGDELSNGTRRQGIHPCRSISATRTDLWSGDRYERWAMPSSLGGGRYTSRSSARLSAAVAILM